MFEDDMDYLRNYDPNIRLIRPEEASQPIPDSWQQIFNLGDPAARVNAALSLWDQVAADNMPETLEFLRERCADVRLAEFANRVAMLYCWVNDVGRNCYYAGGNPLDIRRDTRFVDIWQRLPQGLFEFYSQLHNGFYFYPSLDGGPLPLGEMFWLNQLEWSILDDLEEPLEIDLATSVTFFADGGGGYLVYDYANQQAAEWWSDDEPDYVDSFWESMDEATSYSLAE